VDVALASRVIHFLAVVANVIQFVMGREQGRVHVVRHAVVHLHVDAIRAVLALA
jgi:hypothetical protein